MIRRPPRSPLFPTRRSSDLIKVFSGVPRGISTKPVLAILPTSENTLVPALLALPVSVNQAGPLATMGAMLYQVSTLLMLVGQPHRPFCAGNGGRASADSW